MSRDIPYRQAGWLAATGGVHGTTLAADVAAAAAQQPWALVVHRSAAPTILIRETSSGLHIRVDQFVQRIDTPGTVRTTAWVTKYGAPLPDTAVALAWIGRIQGTGGGPDDDPQAPRAPLPDINVPSDVLSFAGSTRTGADGRAELQIDVAAVGDVRGYLDGQIYALVWTPGRAERRPAPVRSRHSSCAQRLRAARPSELDARRAAGVCAIRQPVSGDEPPAHRPEQVRGRRAVARRPRALPGAADRGSESHAGDARSLREQAADVAGVAERTRRERFRTAPRPPAAPRLRLPPIEGPESAHPDARNADSSPDAHRPAVCNGRGDSGA